MLILLGRGFADVKLTECEKNLQNSELDSAERNCNLAAIFNPLSWDAQHHLFAIHMEKDEPELALINARTALRLAPTVSELHRALALAQVAVGDTVSAIASYRNAIATAPRAAADAYIELADLLTIRGRTDESAEVLLSLTDALQPFTEGYYTAPTAGYRYIVAGAWLRLADIWRNRCERCDSGDSAMVLIAEERALYYSTPRETDKPLTLLGFDSPSPEITVVRFFDAIASGDTLQIKELSTYQSGSLPYFADDVTITVERILDVREEPLTGMAEVEVLLTVTDSVGSVSHVKSSFSLILIEGHWVISFRSGRTARLSSLKSTRSVNDG